MIILTTNLILRSLKNKEFYNEGIFFEYTALIIRTKRKGTLIGYIGYKYISETKDSIEINYDFLDKESFGFLAFEAIKGFVGHLFIIEKKNLKQIIFKSLKTDVKNHILMKRLDAKKIYIDKKYIYWELPNPREMYRGK